jgi:non-homologous end joining protein Ku
VLECQHISVPVSLRGASERQDVTFDTATEDVHPIKRIETDAVCGAVEVEVEREIEVPPTGRQRKPRKKKITEKLTAYLPYEGRRLKGVREGDEFFVIEESEVEKINELTKLDTLTIQEFIPLADVPWERAQACYFLAPPKGVGARALKTLHDAMEAKGVAGVAKLMPKSRQKLALIYPRHGGLLVTCLAYASTFEKVETGAATISTAEVNPEAVKLTEKLIDLMAAPASVLNEYSDDLIELKADLIERAKLGEPLVDEQTAERELAEVEREQATDDTLIERLRESVEQAREAVTA